MSARAAVFIATSLDGFIAREDGSLDWLSEASAGLPEGEDCGYGDFMAGIDAIFMGRKTFEQVLGFGAWPYGRTEMVVMSRQGVAIPSELAGTDHDHPAGPGLRHPALRRARGAARAAAGRHGGLRRQPRAAALCPGPRCRDRHVVRLSLRSRAPSEQLPPTLGDRGRASRIAADRAR